jgi:hypothetical protein
MKSILLFASAHLFLLGCTDSSPHSYRTPSSGESVRIELSTGDEAFGLVDGASTLAALTCDSPAYDSGFQAKMTFAVSDSQANGCELKVKQFGTTSGVIYQQLGEFSSYQAGGVATFQGSDGSLALVRILTQLASPIASGKIAAYSATIMRTGTQVIASNSKNTAVTSATLSIGDAPAISIAGAEVASEAAENEKQLRIAIKCSQAEQMLTAENICGTPSDQIQVDVSAAEAILGQDGTSSLERFENAVSIADLNPTLDGDTITIATELPDSVSGALVVGLRSIATGGIVVTEVQIVAEDQEFDFALAELDAAIEAQATQSWEEELSAESIANIGSLLAASNSDIQNSLATMSTQASTMTPMGLALTEGNSNPLSLSSLDPTRRNDIDYLRSEYQRRADYWSGYHNQYLMFVGRVNMVASEHNTIVVPQLRAELASKQSVERSLPQLQQEAVDAKNALDSCEATAQTYYDCETERSTAIMKDTALNQARSQLTFHDTEIAKLRQKVQELRTEHAEALRGARTNATFANHIYQDMQVIKRRIEMLSSHSSSLFSTAGASLAPVTAYWLYLQYLALVFAL